MRDPCDFCPCATCTKGELLAEAESARAGEAAALEEVAALRDVDCEHCRADSDAIAERDAARTEADEWRRRKEESDGRANRAQSDLDDARAEAERAKKLIEERVAANLEDHAREIEKVRAEERAKWRELAKALDSEPVFRPGPAAYARGYSSAIASVRAQLKQMGVLP